MRDSPFIGAKISERDENESMYRINCWCSEMSAHKGQDACTRSWIAYTNWAIKPFDCQEDCNILEQEPAGLVYRQFLLATTSEGDPAILLFCCDRAEMRNKRDTG